MKRSPELPSRPLHSFVGLYSLERVAAPRHQGDQEALELKSDEWLFHATSGSSITRRELPKGIQEYARAVKMNPPTHGICQSGLRLRAMVEPVRR